MITQLTQSEYAVLNDDEILLENVIEGKHHKLARSIRSGLTDRDLKPDAGTRDQLHAIVDSPPTKTLASEEQDLVWRFRFYLSNQKKVYQSTLSGGKKNGSMNVLLFEGVDQVLEMCQMDLDV